MKKRMLLILILLLLIAAAIFFALFNKKKVNKLPDVMQGTTVLHSGDIQMKVWDYNTVDGDTVIVFFDDKIIFDSLYITNTPAVYHFKGLATGDHILMVKAINEGISSPATPHVSLSDGITAVDFDINAYIDSTGSRKISIEK